MLGCISWVVTLCPRPQWGKRHPLEDNWCRSGPQGESSSAGRSFTIALADLSKFGTKCNVQSFVFFLLVHLWNLLLFVFGLNIQRYASKSSPGAPPYIWKPKIRSPNEKTVVEGLAGLSYRCSLGLYSVDWSLQYVVFDVRRCTYSM